MRKYQIGWMAIAVAIIGLEVAALIDDTTGDTLSENVWMLVHAMPWLRLAGVGALIWAGFHLFGKR